MTRPAVLDTDEDCNRQTAKVQKKIRRMLKKYLPRPAEAG
jgi:hypothetical protein